MIIWTRWGILVFFCFGLAVGTGFLLNTITIGASDDGAVTGMFVGVGLIIGAVYVWLLSKFLLDRVLDKPRQVYMQQPVMRETVDANGQATQVRTGEMQQMPVMNPATGEPLWQKPSSSLFFIPVRVWPYLFAAGGVLIFILCLTSLQAR